MTNYLLDTNVLSELARSRPSPGVVSAMSSLSLDAMFLSDVVIAEIRFGIESAPDVVRRETLLKWLNIDIRRTFAGRIVPVTEDILVRWRWIIEAGRRKGYTFEQSDALLAATADHHRLTVLTRDCKPFTEADVASLNPWRMHR